MYANSLNINKYWKKIALLGPRSYKLTAVASSVWQWRFFQPLKAWWSLLSHPAIMVEYYQILGVRRDASADDIKKAWVDQILLSSNKWFFLISHQTQFVILI